MDPLELIHMQIGLEYRLDESGLLEPCPGSTEHALYLVYEYSLGYVPFYGSELPATARQKIITLGPKSSFDDPESTRDLIESAGQGCKCGYDKFWSGYIKNPPKPEDYPQATRMGGHWVILRDGDVICQACSVRQDERCAEVYVESLPAFRRQGYGRQVVAAWACDVMNSGRVAFYSYKIGNNASAALARSLGVEWYANVAGFEEK